MWWSCGDAGDGDGICARTKRRLFFFLCVCVAVRDMAVWCDVDLSMDVRFYVFDV